MTPDGSEAKRQPANDALAESDTFDPESLATVVVPREDSPHYLTIAASTDFDAIEAMDRAASRDEVNFPLTAATIRWLTLDNPAGRGFVVVAKVRTTHELVGHFLFYPKRLSVDGVTRRVFLYVTLFVAPAYRGAGVFSSMTRYGFDLLARGGIAHGYTVPNPRSAPGFLRLGNSIIGHVPFWAAPARGIPGLIRGLASPLVGFARGLRVERATGFDERHSNVIETAPPLSRRVWGERSLAELQWRFERRPGVTYRIWDVTRNGALKGYVVDRRMKVGHREVAAVCDAWSSVGESGVMAAYSHATHRLGGDDAADIAIVLASPDGATSALALLGAGMVRIPQRFLPQPVAVIGGSMNDAPAPAWMNPGGLARWHITPFDWDVF